MGTPYSLSARCVQTHPSLNAASLIKQMMGGADPTALLLARESAPPFSRKAWTGGVPVVRYSEMMTLSPSCASSCPTTYATASSADSSPFSTACTPEKKISDQVE